MNCLRLEINRRIKVNTIKDARNLCRLRGGKR